MNKSLCIMFITLVFGAPLQALDKKDVKALIRAAYPGASISEIEKETCNGKWIYEIDFMHEGRAWEAIVGLDGEIIKVQIDDRGLRHAVTPVA